MLTLSHSIFVLLPSGYNGPPSSRLYPSYSIWAVASRTPLLSRISRLLLPRGSSLLVLDTLPDEIGRVQGGTSIDSDTLPEVSSRLKRSSLARPLGLPSSLLFQCQACASGRCLNPHFFYLLVSCLSHQIHLLSLPRSSNCVSDVT